MPTDIEKMVAGIDKKAKRLDSIEIEKQDPGAKVKELDAESAYLQSVIDSDIHAVRALTGNEHWMPTEV